MLGVAGEVSRELAGFEHRAGQVEMARAVAVAFCKERVVVVEAGTGVGKSLAYGLPAALWARQSGRPVVISSATINLQEQLVHKDLPLVARVLGGELEVVLVKGRANYLCRRRLEDATRQRLLVERGAADRQLAALADWAEQSGDGSRSDLPFRVDEAVWSEVCSDADACLGRRCPHRGSCFFACARQAAERAQLLVVNHHLLFADLALRLKRDNWKQRAVLPAFERVVLDEAHGLEDAASSFFGVRITRAGALRTLSRLRAPRAERGVLSELAGEVAGTAGALAAGRGQRLASEAGATVAPLVAKARDAYRRAFDALEAMVCGLARGPLRGDARLRLTGEVHGHEAWCGVRESFAEAAGLAVHLAAGAERLIEGLAESELDEGRVAEACAAVLRVRELADATRHLIHEDPDGAVRWAEADRRGRRRCSMVSAPLEVAGLLNQVLFEQMDTAVLTSATLSVGGSFDFLCARVGVDRQPDERVQTLLVDSPFDYASQVRLGLPDDLPPPDLPQFEQALPEAVFQVVAATGGHALVLFTSWSLMTRVHHLIGERLEELGIEVLCQGEAPRDRLLNRFREDPSSVLFGTDSFWQGVDVIGPALRSVIVTRLPFDVPDEPLVQARREALEREGRSAFATFILPRAVLKLKQGFGRLVRARSDWGAVVVMDTRLAGRSYGKRFLASLPPATRLAGGLQEICDRIADFFAAHGEAATERVVAGDWM